VNPFTVLMTEFQNQRGHSVIHIQLLTLFDQLPHCGSTFCILRQKCRLLFDFFLHFESLEHMGQNLFCVAVHTIFNFGCDLSLELWGEGDVHGFKIAQSRV
jgi:hypothetical protein